METNSFRCSLDVSALFSQSWIYTQKHFLPVFVVIFMIVVVMVSPNAIFLNFYKDIFDDVMMLSGPQLIDEGVLSSIFSMVVNTIITTIICAFIAMYLFLVLYRMSVNVIEKGKVNIVEAFKDGLRGYFFFLGSYIVYSLMVSFGCTLCFIPGIYLAVRLMFLPILAANKPELTFGELLSRSLAMTDGRFFEVLLLGIVMALINIVGFFVCCVGMYLTSIITLFMYAEAYRRLLGEGGDNGGSPVDNNGAQQQAYMKNAECGYVK